MTTLVRQLVTAGVFALAAHAAVAQLTTTIQGPLAPGVYGRIDIGNAPPPPVIYPQPLIIERPAVQLGQAPLYLRVPPGHEKHWGKHCRKYNACGQPVYFVREGGFADYRRRQGDDNYKNYKEYKEENKENKEKKNKGDKHGNARGGRDD